MKKLIVITTAFLFLVSCKYSGYKNSGMNYSEYAQKQFDSLKPPIVLLAKSKSMHEYRVTVIDANDKILSIGNMAAIANSIGESYKVKDTILNNKTMESKYYNILTRLTRYVISINEQKEFDVQLSISKNHLLLQLWNDEDNVLYIEESINNLNKIEEDVLVDKINEICVKLDRYRNK